MVQLSNMLTETAFQLLAIERDIGYRFDYRKSQRIRIDDFDMYTFMQTWGSTALGFSGIGGQAITSARTYVFVPRDVEEDVYVYFAGKFAYSVPMCEVVREDIRNECMASVSGKHKYFQEKI